MNFSESYSEVSIMGGTIAKIVGNPLACTGKNIKGESTKDMQVEAIVVPSNGSSMTYSVHLYMTGQHKNTTFIPKDIKILSAEGSEKLGRWDGILEADDITYSDSEVILLHRIWDMDLSEQRNILVHLFQMEQKNNGVCKR